MELLCEGQNPRNAEKYLSLLFQGIHSFQLDEENMAITAISSNLDNKLVLQTSVKLDKSCGAVHFWLQEVRHYERNFIYNFNKVTF